MIYIFESFLNAESQNSPKLYKMCLKIAPMDVKRDNLKPTYV